MWGVQPTADSLACVRPGRAPRAFLRRTRAAGGAFSPPDITGLTFWLKADGTLWQDSGRTTAVSADADPVGSWDDASGGGRHYSQSTSGNRPAYRTNVLNGLPVVRFDGTDDYLTGVLGTSKTYFFVAKYSAATFATYNGLYGQDASGTIVFTSGGAGATTWFATSADKLYRNGADNTAAANAPMNAFECQSWERSTALTGSAVLGNDRGDTSRSWNGDVAEVVAYDSVLSAADRQSVEQYLSAKWGLGF